MVKGKSKLETLNEIERIIVLIGGALAIIIGILRIGDVILIALPKVVFGYLLLGVGIVWLINAQLDRILMGK